MFTPLLSALRTRVRRSATDTTDAAATGSALVLAPHPDDETIGCGATIMRKLAAGAEVTAVVFTDGADSHRNPYMSATDLAALRRAETAEAAVRLGLPSDRLRHLAFPDGSLTGHEDELTRVVTDLVEELAPAEVYVTGAFEPHADHAALGRAARRAVATQQPAPVLFEYPVWLWLAVLGSDAGALPVRLRRLCSAAAVLLSLRRAVAVRTDPYASGKAAAMDAHASQQRRPPGVPDEQPWPGLPPTLLAAAADDVELFVPWIRR